MVHAIETAYDFRRQGLARHMIRALERVKARLILITSTNTNRESVAYRSFRPSEFEARGVRKVTTGITGLWQPSVHSDVAF